MSEHGRALDRTELLHILGPKRLFYAARLVFDRAASQGRPIHPRAAGGPDAGS